VFSSQTLNSTTIPGCYLIEGSSTEDVRGRFTKVFQSNAIDAAVECQLREQFWTLSHANVLRGMHFQIPPRDHAKLVFAAEGEVLDVVIDLRRGSPAFGRVFSAVLSAENSRALWIPRGLAHGFYVTKAPAILVYSVTAEYSSEHDQGVHWNSIGFSWPSPNPLTSVRDQSFVPFEQFDSPFVFDANERS